MQIGGGKLLEKAAALHLLASRCDGLVFVGMMAFQIMHAQGLPVPMKFVEHGAFEEALKIIQIAKLRRIPILSPKDFWCLNNHIPNQLELFPAHRILDGKLLFLHFGCNVAEYVLVTSVDIKHLMMLLKLLVLWGSNYLL